jgi:hypothetical protein
VSAILVLAVIFLVELAILVDSVVRHASHWAQGACVVFALVVGAVLANRIAERQRDVE